MGLEVTGIEKNRATPGAQRTLFDSLDDGSGDRERTTITADFRTLEAPLSPFTNLQPIDIASQIANPPNEDEIYTALNKIKELGKTEYENIQGKTVKDALSKTIRRIKGLKFNPDTPKRDAGEKVISAIDNLLLPIEVVLLKSPGLLLNHDNGKTFRFGKRDQQLDAVKAAVNAYSVLSRKKILINGILSNKTHSTGVSVCTFTEMAKVLSFESDFSSLFPAPVSLSDTEIKIKPSLREIAKKLHLEEELAERFQKDSLLNDRAGIKYWDQTLVTTHAIWLLKIKHGLVLSTNDNLPRIQYKEPANNFEPEPDWKTAAAGGF